MSHRIERISLPATSIGTERHILVHRFGKVGARPKVYLQASLHADELPGQLTLHHLLPQLIEADAAGLVQGEIILVPACNPIGLGQHVDYHHLGRFELNSGHNFNRYYPDLTERAAELAETQLGSDPQQNVAILRAALVQALDEIEPASENEFMKLALMRMAIDADIVLDLHCDFDALMHMYISDPLWPGAKDLAGFMGMRGVLMAVESGDNPFDESLSLPWVKLNKKYAGRYAVPADACLSTTLELRGQTDVRHDYAAQDAQGLYRFLVWRNVIRGEKIAPPSALCEATPLAATQSLKSPGAGIIVYVKEVGAVLKKGDHVADVVNVYESDPAKARKPVYAGTDGLLLVRSLMRHALPGESIAKIVGREILAERVGKKLSEA